MCEKNKHDFIIAGFGDEKVVLICRHCGEKKVHKVNSNFKPTSINWSIEEKQ
jgi:hypothetical protein